MMGAVTHAGGARVTVGVGVALLALDPRLGLAALLANAASHAVVQVLKRVVARPRPCDPDGRALALVHLPDPFSFPSGHAAAATAVAASRVALRVHYVTDVVAGAALGLGAAVGVTRILF